MLAQRRVALPSADSATALDSRNSRELTWMNHFVVFWQSDGTSSDVETLRTCGGELADRLERVSMRCAIT